jgi:hypothetical protein
MAGALATVESSSDDLWVSSLKGDAPADDAVAGKEFVAIIESTRSNRSPHAVIYPAPRSICGFHMTSHKCPSRSLK